MLQTSIFLETWFRNANQWYRITSWLGRLISRSVRGLEAELLVAGVESKELFLNYLKKFIEIFFSIIFFLIFLEPSETCARNIQSKLEQKVVYAPILMDFFMHTFQMVWKKISDFFSIILESSEIHFDLVARKIEAKLNFSSKFSATYLYTSALFIQKFILYIAMGIHYNELVR